MPLPTDVERGWLIDECVYCFILYRGAHYSKIMYYDGGHKYEVYVENEDILDVEPSFQEYEVCE